MEGKVAIGLILLVYLLLVCATWIWTLSGGPPETKRKRRLEEATAKAYENGHRRGKLEAESSSFRDGYDMGRRHGRVEGLIDARDGGGQDLVDIDKIKKMLDHDRWRIDIYK